MGGLSGSTTELTSYLRTLTDEGEATHNMVLMCNMESCNHPQGNMGSLSTRSCLNFRLVVPGLFFDDDDNHQKLY